MSLKNENQTTKWAFKQVYIAIGSQPVPKDVGTRHERVIFIDYAMQNVWDSENRG